MNSNVMKGRLFCDELNALSLLEFKHELKLLKRIIKITEGCVEKKAVHETNTFDGVCYYIARSIVQYSKVAFDNLILGHYDACEMVNRTIIENKVILDMIYFDNTSTLWKNYIMQAHWMAKKARGIDPAQDKFISDVLAESSISRTFVDKENRKKPYIEMAYGWAYERFGSKKFDFENLCKINESLDYKEFQHMSQYSHNTSFYRKVIQNSGIDRIMGLIAVIYMGMYELVTHYCDGIWDDDFDRVTWELESIFRRYMEEYESTALE